MNKKCNVAIIIVNWNGWRDTIECVKSCQLMDYSYFQIVIVDNCSSDNSEEILRRELTDENITILQSGDNLGFTGGNNFGIRHALLNEDIEYVWLLNNDTIVDKFALGELLQTFRENNRIGIVGSKIYYYDSDVLWFAGGSFNKRTGYIKHLGLREKDNPKFSQQKEVDFISGCSLFMPVKVLNKIGLLDDNYFLYFEDTDWNFKVRKEGLSIVYQPKSIVWHKISQSVGEESAIYYYYIFRNSLFFTKKHIPTLFMRIFIFRCLEILRYALKRKWKAVRFSTKGVLHFLQNKSGKQ